jgi:hypothetical protein
MEYRDAGSRMWNSFAGFPDGLGDTQPMDTQLYLEHSDLNVSRIVANDNARNNEDHTTGAPTYIDGDTGHIDLVGCLEDTLLVPDEDDDVSLGEDEEDADELGLGSHFRLPKTPATIGEKRDHRGQLISSEAKTSAIKTPGSALAAIFGNDKGGFGMSMTQAFNQTQAPSSPLADGLRSDPVFQRPSPSVRQSSPLPMSMSSPMKPLANDLINHDRINSDPFDSYFSMKESQERRLREKNSHTRSEDDDDDDFEELTEAQRLAEQRRRKLKIQELVSKSCEGLTAPPRSSARRPNKIARRRSATDISSTFTPVTPMTRNTSNNIQTINSELDVVPTDDDGEDELSQPAPDSAVQVPMTSSRPIGRSQPNGYAHHTSPVRSQDRREISQRFDHGHVESPNATQKTVAVADSQGDVSQPFANPRPSLKVGEIASSSQIAQSQYASVNRKTRVLPSRTIAAVDDTSSVPRPPPPTTQVLDDESLRLPSSPPVVPVDLDTAMRHLVDSPGDVHLNDSKLDDSVLVDRGNFAQDLITNIGLRTTIVGTRDQSQKLSRGAQKDGDELTHESQKENDPFHTQEQNNGVPLAIAMEEEAATATSRGTEVFETAPSYLPAPSPSMQNLGLAPGTRKLSDIAADRSQNQSFESVDIPNIMSQDDDDFLKATEPGYKAAEQPRIISSPLGSSPVRPNKRRKLTTYGKRALREPAQNLNVQFSIRNEEPVLQQDNPDKERMLSPVPPVVIEPNEDGDAPVEPELPQPPPVANAPRTGAKRNVKKTSKITYSAKSKAPVRAPTTSSRPKARSLRVLEVAETPQSKSGDSNQTPRQSSKDGRSKNLEPVTEDTEARSRAASEQVDQTIPSVEAVSESVPARVLARFRGNKMAYYPATCIGLAHTDGLRLKIRFDDGTIDNIETLHVRKLALQVGDWVKVDLPNMRTKTYVVRGLKDRTTLPTDSRDELTEPEPADFPATTVHGFLAVQLAVKTRDSLPIPGPTAADIVDVPVSSIYVTTSMWSHFKDRRYTHSIADPTTLGRVTTPSVMLSGPSTPTSRSRRQLLANFSTAPLQNFPSGPVRPQSQLFANMAFAVTFTDPDGTEKNNSMKIVQDHGGLILEAGFDQLFDVTAPEPLSPSKTAAKKSVIANTSDPVDALTEPLRLLPTAKNLGFTALIADRFCRRAKYMQALALDIPCLHYRWLYDCKAASTVLPWQKYLLPAGESTFLSGSVRSRTLTPYDPLSEAAGLQKVLDRRQLLLGDKNVLLIMGKGRAEERRKAYLFLTYALGAANVGRVKDLADAKKLLDGDETWDWVYVDTYEQEAEHALFSAAPTPVPLGGATKPKKRKRGDSVDTPVDTYNGKNVKVVGDEFVIQSLILGALMEI